MLDGDYTAIEKCEFCEGTFVAIKKLEDGYLVQCENCGAISKVATAYKNNNKPSRMAKVRKIKQRFYEKE